MGLLDIAPPEVQKKHFSIRGKILSVRGIKNKEWVVLLKRFPEFRKQLATTEPIENMGLIENGLIPAIIAAGSGHLGDEEYEKAASENLNDIEQQTIFSAIMQLTSPEPPKEVNGPFVESPEAGQLLGENQTMMNSQQPLLL